jgi:hypothetical protein
MCRRVAASESQEIILSHVGATIDEFWIGFIDTLYTVLGTTGSYSTVADLHTSQFTVTHTLGFSVFTSHLLAMDFSVSLSIQIKHEVVFSQSNSLLAIILQLPIPKILFKSIPLLTSQQAGIPKLDSSLLIAVLYSLFHLLTVSFYNPSARTTQKTAFIVKDACLLVQYLAVNLLLLHAYTLQECVYQVVS